MEPREALPLSSEEVTMPVLALIKLLLDCQRSARLMKAMMLLSKSADTPASRFPGETVSTHNGGVDDRIFIEIFRSLDRQQLSKFQPGSLTRLFIVPVGHPHIFAASWYESPGRQ